jgi:hypothetical protein
VSGPLRDWLVTHPAIIAARGVVAAIEYTALGLSLDSRDEAYDVAQPLEAVVIVKGLDSDDQVRYWAMKTPDLPNVEAMGMAMWAYEVAKNS